MIVEFSSRLMRERRSPLVESMYEAEVSALRKALAQAIRERDQARDEARKLKVIIENLSK